MKFMKAYPTINNQRDGFGLPVYEIRGQKLYPTVHNQRDGFGLPGFELRA